MMIYALQIKQKSITGFFLQNFRTATFENYFGGDRSEKKTEEGMRIKLCGLKF